jgi:threonine dehydrogenase-like Zn-dependent dehydrogenase
MRLRHAAGMSLLGWSKGANFNLDGFYHHAVFDIFLPWTLKGNHLLHSLRMMEQGEIRVAPLIAHRTSYEKAPDIYRTVLNAPDNSSEIVFNWDR